MATVAARAPKRDLAPDWRDALRESARRLAVRTWGVLLLGVGVGGAVALASHDANDPSLSTAAGGPPANWLGSSGAYASDVLLTFFGLGAVLLLPVIAIAGLRMMRLEPAGRIGRGLLLAAIGAVMLGTALGLTSFSAVSGLPGGWGGALGLAAAHGVDAGVGMIANPSIAGPARLTTLLLFGLAGIALGYVALGLTAGEKHWLGNLFRRSPRERIAPPRATQVEQDRARTTVPPRARPSVAVAEPARGIAPAGRAQGRKSSAQPSLALGDSYALPTLDLLARPNMAASRSTAPRSSATRVCSKACSRISTFAATSSRSAPARW